MRIAAVRALKNSQSASRTPEWRRRRLTSALLVLGLTVGSVAMTASPVDAASVVATCFQRTGPTYWVRDQLNVHLMAWTGVRWEQIGFSQKIDETGCTVFFVPLVHQDKYLFTELVDVGTGGRFYHGYSSVGYFLWNNTWNLITTIYGAQYAPWLPYALPGDNTWALLGTYQCQVSYPVPFTPC